MTRRLPAIAPLTDSRTMAVFDALEAAGGADCVRLVGGCVRNALTGHPVADVDLATTMTPDQVIAALKAAGLKAVPTGVEHGTVTAISGRQPFEITTLRRDVSTDGRNATVAFTDDWAEDAARRDFRLNALYAARDLTVFDPTGAGVDDALAGRIVFVGDPETRIREDYLRILRFFRFHAWYGRETPDAAGLAACARLKDGMSRLSAERISAELLKLLAAPDPVPAVRLMAEAGILAQVLPAAVDLTLFEVLAPISDDPLLRLSALLPEDAALVDEAASALRLSNAQRSRLAQAVPDAIAVDPTMDDRAARAAIYRLGSQAFQDRLIRTQARAPGPAGRAEALLDLARTWIPPRLPVGGREAAAAGLSPGPATGQVLRALEDWWVDNDFPVDGAQTRLAELIKETDSSRNGP